MDEKKVTFKELLNPYTQNLGAEGAEKIIKEAVAEAMIILKDEFTKQEVLKICEVLKKRGGYIKIIANLFAARLILH